MRTIPRRITVPLFIASFVLLVYWVVDAAEISKGVVLATGPVVPLYISLFLTAVASAGLLVCILYSLKAEKRQA